MARNVVSITPHTLAAHWWATAIRGLAAVVFGLFALLRPPVVFLVVVAWFGVCLIADGGLALFAAIRAIRNCEPRGSLAVGGAASLIAGLIAFFQPRIGALGLVLMLGTWALARGIAEVVAAVRLRKQIQGGWLLTLSGILSVASAVVLFLAPGAGAAAAVLTLCIGACSLALGAVTTALALRLKAWDSRRAHAFAARCAARAA